MKLILLILSFLILAVQPAQAVVMVNFGQVYGETYDYVERFDGSTLCVTSYTSNCNNSWRAVEAGTPNFQNATAPAPTEGSYSLSLPPASQVSFYFGDSTDIYISWLFQLDGMVDADETIARIYDDASQVCGLKLRATGTLRVTATGGTEQTSGSTGFTGATPIYLKLRYVQGTGADALCQVWYSSDGTSWTSGAASTNGTTTGVADEIHFEGETDTETLFFDIMKIKKSGDITDGR